MPQRVYSLKEKQMCIIQEYAENEYCAKRKNIQREWVIINCRAVTGIEEEI